MACRVVLQNRQLQSLLVHMKILHSLNLSYLSTAMDDDLASLTELQQLHTLILAHSDVYLFAMMWITALTNLTSLDVQASDETLHVHLRCLSDTSQSSQGAEKPHDTLVDS